MLVWIKINGEFYTITLEFYVLRVLLNVIYIDGLNVALHAKEEKNHIIYNKLTIFFFLFGLRIDW